MNKLYAFVNESIVPNESAALPIGDLGIQRGYGIFDFFRVDGIKPLFIQDHLERFYNSAAQMRLTINYSHQEIEALIYELVTKNNLTHSGLKILLTGGDAEDGYTVSSPRLSIVQQELKPPPQLLPDNGIRLVTREYQRQLAEAKTSDYLMAIWLQEWMKSMQADDILYYHNGWIRECPRSNFFIISHEDVLVTPASGMLKGVTRKNIIKASDKLDISLEIRDVHINELKSAKGAFICSSTKRIMPVYQVDQFEYNISTCSPVLNQLWRELIAME
jgi:D-alanine transaminase/branched-chain amino acid aminotransferase